jgi:hypothetical protein
VNRSDVAAEQGAAPDRAGILVSKGLLALRPARQVSLDVRRLYRGWLMEPWLEVLRKEHEATNESFVMTLRGEGRWDRAAYDRLFDAMLQCCKAHDDQTVIERWIAEVWYLSWWVKTQADRLWPGSRYHENAATNLDHLAWWLFAKQSRRDTEFEPVE